MINVVTSIQLVETGSIPPAPPSGYLTLYMGADKILYIIDSNGTRKQLNGPNISFSYF